MARSTRLIRVGKTKGASQAQYTTAETLALLKLREAEIARLLAVVNDGMKLFKEADEERLKETHDAQAEAERWKADDDMYGWNFHMGMSSGTTHASILFYRVWRHLKKASEATK